LSWPPWPRGWPPSWCARAPAPASIYLMTRASGFLPPRSAGLTRLPPPPPRAAQVPDTERRGRHRRLLRRRHGSPPTTRGADCDQACGAWRQVLRCAAARRRGAGGAPLALLALRAARLSRPAAAHVARPRAPSRAAHVALTRRPPAASPTHRARPACAPRRPRVLPPASSVCVAGRRDKLHALGGPSAPRAARRGAAAPPHAGARAAVAAPAVADWRAAVTDADLAELRASLGETAAAPDGARARRGHARTHARHTHRGAPPQIRAARARGTHAHMPRRAITPSGHHHGCRCHLRPPLAAPDDTLAPAPAPSAQASGRRS
jgi:hypothetical protein